MNETVSIIIPALNEEEGIEAVAAMARSLGPLEILVADGGSTDRTREKAAPWVDAVLDCPKGRAFQMNQAAAQARGDILLFLHADCQLGRNALLGANQTLRRPGVIAGCFQMKVDCQGFAYRVIEKAATARVRISGLIYGDQGLFLRRADFIRLEGFPKVRFMEDLFFSKVLKRHGKLKVAHENILVSPRRWHKHGVVRQTLRNWTLTALALMGVHPDRLANHYPV